MDKTWPRLKSKLCNKRAQNFQSRLSSARFSIQPSRCLPTKTSRASSLCLWYAPSSRPRRLTRPQEANISISIKIKIEGQAITILAWIWRIRRLCHRTRSRRGSFPATWVQLKVTLTAAMMQDWLRLSERYQGTLVESKHLPEDRIKRAYWRVILPPEKSLAKLHLRTMANHLEYLVQRQSPSMTHSSKGLEKKRQ